MNLYIQYVLYQKNSIKINKKFKKWFLSQNLEFLLLSFVKIQDFATKIISWIFYSFLLILFDTGSFIWGITFYNLKYLDKPIKCLKLRANQRSVRKINEIFLCIFTYISKSDIFSTYLNFDKIFLLVTLKAKYPNDPNNVKKYQMFQVTEIFQGRGISKYF